MVILRLMAEKGWLVFNIEASVKSGKREGARKR